jgi:molybdopterin-binding protein
VRQGFLGLRWTLANTAKEPFTKISARNILKGTIVEIVKGATTSHVRIDTGGAVVTASITNEAVADLKLEKGRPMP